MRVFIALKWPKVHKKCTRKILLTGLSNNQNTQKLHNKKSSRRNTGGFFIIWQEDHQIAEPFPVPGIL